MRRCPIISKDSIINEDIRAKEVRLVSADGEQLGVVSLKEALRLASESELDLVNIAPNAIPPVCKIMDFGKYRFEINKKQKEAKKKQKVISIKEIRISPKIEEHDFNVKAKNLAKFLKDGDKVKITVRFRGREVNYQSIGEEILNRFIESVQEFAKVESSPKLEGKNMMVVISPK